MSRERGELRLQVEDAETRENQRLKADALAIRYTLDKTFLNSQGSIWGGLTLITDMLRGQFFSHLRNGVNFSTLKV